MVLVLGIVKASLKILGIGVKKVVLLMSGMYCTIQQKLPKKRIIIPSRGPTKSPLKMLKKGVRFLHLKFKLALSRLFRLPRLIMACSCAMT